jgi:FtsH-binding integral membrane protein
LVIIISILIKDDLNTRAGMISGVLLLGLAATFGVLWLRRKNQPTDWAKYPAVGLFVLSILAFILGDAWNALTDRTKAIVFAVASAVFLVCYLLTGLRKWGWLFPILFCAAISLTMWMSINNLEDTLAAVDQPHHGRNMVRCRGGENRSCTGSVEHSISHKA